jgi:hypothetical protein
LPRSATAASPRSRISGETVRLPLSTYDTVLSATPACAAIWAIVGGFAFGRIGVEASDTWGKSDSS